MSSLKKSNGLPPVIGTLNAPGNASKPVTLMLPSLGFTNTRHARTVNRDAHLGRHDSWSKGRIYQGRSWQRRTQAAAKADARRRALGQLVMGAFIAVTCVMAAVALHREADLQQLEQRVHMEA